MTTNQLQPQAATAAPPAARPKGTFTDGEGRTWAYEIDYGTARRVHRATGLDILKLTDPQSDEFKRAVSDQWLLFDCLVAALEPQLQAAGTDGDGLAAALKTEQQAQDATLALFEAIVNFTQPAKAQVLQATLERAISISQSCQDQAVGILQEALTSGELDRELTAALKGGKNTGTPGG